jgi:hypothetical protein
MQDCERIRTLIRGKFTLRLFKRLKRETGSSRSTVVASGRREGGCRGARGSLGRREGIERRRALFVLAKIDQILAWEREVNNQQERPVLL